MSNPFDGLITQGFKDLHKQAIDAVIDGLAVPCTVYYAGTKFTICPNCVPNNIGGKSANTYKPGGPIPFSHGVCPHCNGIYRIPVEASDTVYLIAIWDARKWIKNLAINLADISVQTMSKITTYDELNRASKIRINEAITKFGTPFFTKLGNPQPIGLGADNYVICSWKRAE